MSSLQKYYSDFHHYLTDEGCAFIQKHAGFPSNQISLGELRHSLDPDALSEALQYGLHRVVSYEQAYAEALVSRHLAGNGKQVPLDANGDSIDVTLDGMIQTNKELLVQAYEGFGMKEGTILAYLQKVRQEAARLVTVINPNLQVNVIFKS